MIGELGFIKSSLLPTIVINLFLGISPILSELAEDYKEKILIAKVNIDENPEVPSNYGIMSIPTLILFKNGKSVSSQIGLVEKSSLTKWLDENL